MKYDLADCVQRGHQFAIVDEVDSILIDEARTPLIISGPAEESTDKYYRIDKIIPKLIQDIDYTLEEKHRTATLTEEGVEQSGAPAGPRQSLRSRAHGNDSPRLPGLARAHALQARRRLRGQKRRSHHRRRIHRPRNARPPLVGRLAPGRGSQGRRQDRARKPDPRHHHLPELFPHVQEAFRHDRHGGNRSGRVQQDLQPRSGGHSHQPRRCAATNFPTWSTAPRTKNTKPWSTA